MNGIRTTTLSMAYYIKWFLLVSFLSILAACGDDLDPDTIPPVISLAGNNPHIQNEDIPYEDAGATAVDNKDGNVTVNVTGNVDHTTPGSYTLTYSATDSSGNQSELTRVVRISDITAPVITLNGATEINVPYGVAYEDLGANATDNYDSGILVTTSGEVNTSEIGQYQVTYSAKDSADNTATVIRTVNVADLIPPVITLNGSTETVIIHGRNTYTEAGASAVDDLDGTVAVTITGDVDDTTNGTYTVTYTSTDSVGNESTATRTVIVRDALPFITTWKTDNEGVSDDNQIRIHTTTDNQNYTVDWGDGTQDSNVSGGITHTYSAAGTYTVSINGDFKNIRFVFNETDHQKLLSIEQWGDTQWTTMEQAFAHCNNLVLNATDIPDLSDVADMSHMFQGASAFNGDISQWDVSSVTDMSFLFSDARKFNRDLSQWDVSSVTDMSSMFYNARAFNGDISLWDLSSVTNMHRMFVMAYAFNRDISQWNVSSVTNMGGMFAYAGKFNSDLSQWDVSSVTNMGGMFNGTTVFNGDISRWDVSSVINMWGMFRSARAFNRDISQWNVSSVTNMSETFSLASQFNGDLSQWDVSSVTDMSEMFWGAAAFNIDISQWDVSSVTDMSKMFSSARTFNRDISQWDVSSVTDMSSMFYNASSFNSDISQWDTSSVTDMSEMFNRASAFNGDISQWDVSSVTNMAEMFNYVTLSTENFDALLQGWSRLTLQTNVNFHAGNSQYSAESESARNVLLNTYGWTIIDGGLVTLK